jgi:SET domain-containing protein
MTTRRVKDGEEIFIDYNDAYWADKRYRVIRKKHTLLQQRFNEVESENMRLRVAQSPHKP